MHGLEAEYWNKVDFVYLDRENSSNRDVVQRYNVRGQPVFIFLDANGDTLQSWYGAPSADELRAVMDAHLGTGG